jgi:hypothetical protein
MDLQWLSRLWLLPSHQFSLIDPRMLFPAQADGRHIGDKLARLKPHDAVSECGREVDLVQAAQHGDVPLVRNCS